MLTLLKRIRTIPKMLKDPSVKPHKKLMILVGIVYLISPVDLIPDPILGLGIIDDATLLFYIVASIKDELDKYLDNNKANNIIDNVDYTIDDE